MTCPARCSMQAAWGIQQPRTCFGTTCVTTWRMTRRAGVCRPLLTRCKLQSGSRYGQTGVRSTPEESAPQLPTCTSIVVAPARHVPA